MQVVCRFLPDTLSPGDKDREVHKRGFSDMACHLTRRIIEQLPKVNGGACSVRHTIRLVDHEYNGSRKVDPA